MITFFFSKIRLHISLTFFIFTFCSSYYLGETASLTASVCFTFWHISAYLINKAFDIEEDSIMNKEPISLKYKNHFIISSLLLLILSLGILIVYKLPLTPYILCIPLGILYSVPIFKHRIKSLFILKNIYAAGATVMASSMVLFYYSNYSEDVYNLIKNYTLYFFLLFLVVEIYSDLPDRFADKSVGVKTIANTFPLSTVRITLVGILIVTVINSLYISNYFRLIIPVFFTYILFFTSDQNISKNIRLFFYGFLVLLSSLSISGYLF